jgi:hypothetical protein
MEQNLRYHQVVITPEDHTCLHNVISHVRRELLTKREDHLENNGPELTYWEDRLLQQVEQLERWKSYVSQSLFKCWSDLPDGDHLKLSYSDQVWTWDDQDLAQIPEDQKVPPEKLGQILADLKVED